MNKKSIAVLGSGIAGLACAIRLSSNGHQVTVLEKSETYGGKMGVWEKDGFRFDTGPSLFTMPHYVDELLQLKQSEVQFEYKKLDVVCNYFWNDGTELSSFADTAKTAKEFQTKLNEDAGGILKFLNKSKKIYAITNHVFLEKSLHKIATYLNWGTIRSIFRLGQIDIFKSMNQVNSKWFKNPKTVQFFNRYATYNGSNPYEAPATLNVIPHYEFGFGAYLPSKGMRNIADALFEKATSLGVEFKFNFSVEKVTKGRSDYVVNKDLSYDAVVCNIDVATASQGPLKNLLPAKKSDYSPSSSALIFYWGIGKVFNELDVHNIFFSDDYKAEFSDIFEKKIIHDDPTVYINITSKMNTTDAPINSENWFVMVNAPHNDNQNWDKIIQEARRTILKKISAVLKVDIESLIKVEHVLEPRLIESKTGSFKGALYGSSSNNRNAAFNRQPNFSKEHKGLYFCGGSVHPGGGIPLCLLSAKITADLIEKDAQKN